MSGNQDPDFKPTWSFAALDARTAKSISGERSSHKPAGGGKGRSSPTQSMASSRTDVALKSTYRTPPQPTPQASSSASTSNTRECAVCTEELPAMAFSTSAITSACTHATNTCKACLKTSIRSDMAIKFWNRISCPECGASLIQEDIERHADSATLERYQKLKHNADLQALPNFRWCAAGCGAGQEHDGGPNQPMIVCRECNARSCFYHDSRWHEGFTCKQWDKVTDPDIESIASTKRAPTVPRSEASSERAPSSVASGVSSRRHATVTASTTSRRRDRSSIVSAAPSVVLSTASSRRPSSKTRSAASSCASVRSTATAITRVSKQNSGYGASDLLTATSPTPSQSSSRTVRPTPKPAVSSASHVSRQTESSGKTQRSDEKLDHQVSQRRLISIREEEEATNLKFSMELARKLQIDEDKEMARFYETESLKTARRLAAEWAAEDNAQQEQLSLGLARRMQDEWAALDQEERERDSASMARRLQEAENASLLNTDLMIAQRLHQEEEAQASSGQHQEPNLRGGGSSLSRPQSPKHGKGSRRHGHDHESQPGSSRSGRRDKRRESPKELSCSVDQEQQSYRQRAKRERNEAREARRREKRDKEVREKTFREAEALLAPRHQDKEIEDREQAAKKALTSTEQKRRELVAATAEKERENQAAATDLKKKREAARAERARMAAERNAILDEQNAAVNEARRRRREERATEEAIKCLSKPCPQCKFDTFKAEGCDHIYCSACQAQWCWACSANWTSLGCGNLGCPAG